MRLAGRHTIIRTLDVGAEQSLPYIPMPAEENPALGLRGIRLCLAREALLASSCAPILAVKPLSALKNHAADGLRFWPKLPPRVRCSIG